MVKSCKEIKGIKDDPVKRTISNKRACDIINNFGRARVLVVGDIIVDHFIWGKVSRISPEAPVPVVDVQTEDLMMGGCTNVLHNINAVGGTALCAGVVGADETGERLLGELRKRGIDPAGVVADKTRPTTLKTRVVAHGQQVVRFDRENRGPVGEENIARILSYVAAVCSGVDALVLSDYNKGIINESLLEGIRKIIAGRDVLVCVDPKQEDFSLYRDFDVITPNHHEAGRAVGRAIENENDLLLSGKTLLEKYGFKAVLITRGEAGISLFEKGRIPSHSLFPTAAKEVYDVTGAGDTVIGVFALCLAAGASFKEAAFLANLAAGIVVGKVGTATVSREELIKAL